MEIPAARASGVHFGRTDLTLLCSLVIWSCSPQFASAQQEEDLRVLNAPGGPWMAYVDAPNALYRHLEQEVLRHLDSRERSIETLRTAEDWYERRRHVRRTLRDVLGPFPEATPLNARVTGVVEREDVRVEKIVFESQPGYSVTAALFLPPGRSAPAPAVLYLSGHSAVAFRSTVYQHVILNLVRKGFVVLAIDPVAQGERLEYLDPETGAVETAMVNTRGHSYPGAQLFLTGNSMAREMTWDAIRAVDYLMTRPEVDPERIGATGRSGGGTQTAYLAAVDERVTAAAIENYVTSFRRLWETRGPQDAEQHFLNGIARGLDHADLLVARAPRPTLVIATTRDIFSIQGAWETYDEAKRAFEALGSGDHLRLVEDDAGHESTRANREALYSFFQEALALPGDLRDEDVEIFAESDLWVTPTGQVATSMDAVTTFDLNERRAARLRAARQAARLREVGQAAGVPEVWESADGVPGVRESADGVSEVRDPADVVAEARRLSVYRDPGEPGDAIFMGRHRRDGYAVEKYVLPGEGGYPIPFLLMLPDGDVAPSVVLFLDPDGKAARAAPGGELEWFVRRGYAVLAPDLLGAGEMGPGDFRGDSYDFGPRGEGPFGLWFGALSAGRSIAGIQASDVVRLVRYVRSRTDVSGEAPSAIARGEFGSVLLHAAAFEPRISGVALVESLRSYDELVATRDYQPRFVPAGVGGMLAAYDLPDLAASLGARAFLFLNPVDGGGNPEEDSYVSNESAIRDSLLEWLSRR